MLISIAIVPCLIHIRSSVLLAQDIPIDYISKTLQSNLNKKRNNPFTVFSSKEASIELNNLYKNFIKRFPDAKWSIKRGDDLGDGRASLDIEITGSQTKGDLLYKLESKQKVGYEIENKKISNSEIISSYSIVRTGNKDIQISVSSPNMALTGTQYEFNLILDKPVKNEILAGGLINLSSKQIKNNLNPHIELLPLGSGGLFKLVQAPLSPGNQYLAAIIAHPDGIISITKSIKIVSNQSSLKN